MTKASAIQYFQANGSLLIKTEERIYILLHFNGTVEIHGIYRGKDGACFTIIKEYKHIDAFMKACNLKALEEIKTLSWDSFLMAGI